jgi:hypothetical protein
MVPNSLGMLDERFNQMLAEADTTSCSALEKTCCHRQKSGLAREQPAST